MLNRYLMPVYKEIYGRDFKFDDFDNRLEMEKIIYLLEEKGVSLGEYSFNWYKHGPYSQALLDDMFHSHSQLAGEIEWSANIKEKIAGIKRIIQSKMNYEDKNWAECLASILFLKTRVLSSKATEVDILKELTSRKPHLNNIEANKEAYKIVCQTFK